MKNKIGFTILLGAMLGAISLPALAYGTADDRDPSAYISAFRELDANHDEGLSKSEARKEALFAKHFNAADTDHDSLLNQEEYTSYKSAHEKKIAKRVISDSMITSKIKAGLLKDEGMKSLQVSVETHAGLVQLSGFVDSEAQILQAEKIASGIAGVKSVKNSLVLKKS